jgi:hypothetical protein
MSKLFKFVHIPCDDTLSPIELEASTAGGLDKDELQAYAKKYFTSLGSDDGTARLESVKHQLAERGIDIATVDPTMLNSLATMGPTIEIITLALGSRENAFLGVSMYCDSNAVNKNFRPNMRATYLARNCGHDSLVVNGDAFIGRCYDNEEEEWQRRDFTLTDILPDAKWISDCAVLNRGKNMSALCSSGALQQSLSGNSISNSSASNPGSPFDDSSEIEVSWSQTKEDIDLRYVLPDNATAKNIKVKIKSSSVSVCLPSDIASVEEVSSSQEVQQLREMLCSESGIELYSNVIADDSTWTVEKKRLSPNASPKNILTITLSKASSLNWPKLNK